MTSTNYRLPRHVVPQDYDVTVDASPKRAAFFGQVIMTARVLKETDRFELNSRDLKVEAASVKLARGRMAAKVVMHRDRETVELVFAKPLPRGAITVTLKFKGKLNPNMHGLYLAKDGNERAIVSQCEATDARAIFPCFDEPDLKATLRWTIHTDPDWVVITNGALESSRKARGADKVVHTFKRTRVIPTYLAAVTIGKLEGSPTFKVKGIPCRIWAGQGKLDQTAFAQEVTSYVLPWYQQYFGQKYNYEKLDQVAVPGFDAGAMENVGAIFYRQNLLLMRPGATSWGGQKRIAEVIAHEIAHQWFGNLVTMRWWDDLWLNEAFATWIAYKVCDTWKPEWRIWDDYLESKEGALAADALVNTHPIYTEVQSPAQATELFDVITYEKGCAVLRMAENYLSHEIFQRGIQMYQAAFKNKNAAGADLWNKLADASNEPVDELMKSWVEQPGFPLLTVTAHRQDNHTVLHVSQRRFFANKEQMQQPDSQTWMVPLVVRYDTGNGPALQRVLLTDQEATLVLGEEGHAHWVYPNANATGFYRMHLEEELLQALLTQGLPHLSPAARMSLIEDQWALVRCGLANVEQFMDVLTAFRDERDHVVVRSMVHRLNYLFEYLVPPNHRQALSSFTCWLFAPQLDELGWEPEPEEQSARSLRRALIVDVLGDVGRDHAVLHEAARRLEDEIRDPTAVEPNLAGTLPSLAAIDGDSQLMLRFVATYTERKKARVSPELQARYLSALSAFEDKEAVAQVLNLCIDGTIPQEQLRVVLIPMLARRATQDVTWTFLKKNWAEIGPRVGSMGVGRLVESTGSLDVQYRADVLKFFTDNPVEEAKRALQKALEAMDLRHELKSREAPRLADWLSRATYRNAARAG